MKLDYRQRLLASTLLVGAATFSAPAFAQTGADVPTAAETSDLGDPAARLCDDNPNSPECAAEGQAIVVTGSRIASPTLTSASPLQIIDSADIDQAGVVNVQEVIAENPTTFVGTSRTNSNFSTASVGVATVDLRNLGTSRTLVLVNGRRFVSGLPGSPVVDLNTIPTQFIERVDILTGGASSIYGSDAVAGVVNIIYKDDFEGIELNGQIGVSEEGDDVRKQANLLLGTNFADGRGNITVHLGYSDEGAVFTRNRSRSAVDQTSCYAGFFGAEIESLFTACRPTLSATIPQATIVAGGINFTYDAATGAPRTFGAGGASVNPGLLLPGETTLAAAEAQFRAINCITRTTTAEGVVTPIPNCTPLGFNRSGARTIAVPTERYLIAFRGNYEITNNISAFAEATYAATSTVAELEPFPFATSGSGGTNPATGGRFNIESELVVNGTGPLPTPATNPSVLSCDAATRVCRVRNPFVPVAIFNAATDLVSINDTDNFRDVSFTRRLSDLGNRGATADRDTFRVLVGLEGDIFSDWRWDAFYSYGETTEAQVSGGQVNVLNFRNALNAVPDLNDVDGDGNRNEAICADAQARAQGCQPTNVFQGANMLSPAAIQYINAPAFFNTKTTQKLAGANLSGNLFDLWGAGPVGLAIGTEYRKEFSSAQSDPLTVAGLNGGNARGNTEGSFDVIEGYAELAVPLLRDVPFFHMLEARGAIRVSDYSTVGTTYSWNYGLEWAPIPDVRFRAVKARATRAPNIGELFAGPGQTFPPGLVDPCRTSVAANAVTNATPGTLGERCRADPGVQLNINQNISAANPNGIFVLNQSDTQSISGFNLSNPNLKEEKADSFTAGIIINPTSIRFLRNFSFTADYFNIKVDDAIQSLGRQFILNQCFQEGNLDLCSAITRRPGPAGANSAGSIELINDAQTNTGGLKTEGLDFTMSYRQNLENWGLAGNLNMRLAWTHLLEAFSIPVTGQPKDSFKGEIGAPKDRVFGTVAYTLGGFTGVLRGNYNGPQYLNDSFQANFSDANGDPFDKKFFRVGSVITLDSQIRFATGDHYEFYVGVDNLTDEQGPLIPTGLSGGGTGVETNASIFDPIGRRYYAGATLKF